VRSVAVERARRRELAELVANHFLGDHHRDVLLAVVDAERQPDELRQDGGAAAPDPDHFVARGAARLLRFSQEIAIDERALPNRTCHSRYPLGLLLPRVAADHDELRSRLVLTGLLALGREAPGRRPVLAALGATAVGMVDRIHGDAAVV